MIDGVRRIKHVRVVVGKYSGTWWYKGLIGLFVLALIGGVFSQVDFTRAVTRTLTQTTWTTESGFETLTNTSPGSNSFSTYASGQSASTEFKNLDLSDNSIKLKEEGKTISHTSFSGANADFGTPATTARITSGIGATILVPQLTSAANLQDEKILFGHESGLPAFGQNVDIAFDNNNYPHVIFDSRGKLIYSHFVGTGGTGCASNFSAAWDCEEVTSDIGTNNTGADAASITVDDDGTVFIAVRIDNEVEILAKGANMPGNHSERYVTSCSRGGVTVADGWYCPKDSSVGQDVDQGIEIAVDSESNPYVTFMEGPDIYVYGISDAGNWTGGLFDTTYSGNAYARASLVIEKNSQNIDQLHLAYFKKDADWNNNGQKIFHAQIALGASPSTIQSCDFYSDACAQAGARIASATANPHYINIAVVPGTADVHLVYNKSSTDEVYYTNNVSGFWLPHHLLEDSELSSESSPRIVEIGVGDSGKPFLATQMKSTKKFKICRMTSTTGTTCTGTYLETVAVGNTYQDMAFAVSGTDVPALAYTDNSPGQGALLATTNFINGATYTNDFGAIGYSGVLASNAASLTKTGGGTATASVNVGAATPGVSVPYTVTFTLTAGSYIPPVVTAVTLTYNSYKSSGTLYSPIFDTTQQYSVLQGNASVTGDADTEEGVGGGTMKIFMRSGPTVPTESITDPNITPLGWTEWLGKNGGGYYSFGETVDAAFAGGNNDRYFQYSIELTSTGGTKVLKDISFEFSVNDAPKVTNTDAAQQLAGATDEGEVYIYYDLEDTDNNGGSSNHRVNLFYDAGISFSSFGLGATELNVVGSTNGIPNQPGTLVIGNELLTYTGISGGKFIGIERGAESSSLQSQDSLEAGPVVWVQAVAGARGAVGNSVSEGNGKQIIWNAGMDITTYRDMEVRVVAINDVELGNTLSMETGATATILSLDTGSPTISGITLTGGDGNTDRTNSTDVAINLNDVFDNAGESTLQMKVTGNISDPDSDWVSYSSSVSKTLAPRPGSKTIKVDLRDLAGNKAVATKKITLDQDAPNVPGSFARIAVCDQGVTPAIDRAYLSWTMPTGDHANFAGFQIDYDSGSSDGVFQADIDLPTADLTSISSYTSSVSDFSTGSYVFAIRTYDTLNNFSAPTSYTSAITLATDCDIDSEAPVITHDSVANVSVTQTTATITWTTHENADTYIDYVKVVDGVPPEGFDMDEGNDALVESHSFTLSNLKSGTTYNYQVRSKDGSKNESTDGVHSFTTDVGDDITKPNIFDVSIAAKEESAIVTWKTNEVATSLVTVSGTNSSVSDPKLELDHSITITGLTAGSPYSITIESSDGATPPNTGSQTSSFSTISNSVQTKPIIAPGSITKTDITGYSAVINWEVSNEAADSYIEYGLLQVPVEGEPPVFTHLAGSSDLVKLPASGNAMHSVKLLGLTPETDYQFRIKTTNDAGNTRIYPLGPAVEVVRTVEGDDTTDPVIDNVSVLSVTESRATIQWTANEPTNKWVDYSIGGTVFNEEAGMDTFTDTINGVVTHQVTLLGLTPGEDYFFQVRSEDQARNVAIDHNGFLGDGVNPRGYEFSTDAAPDSVIAIDEESVTASNITTTSAKISWTTNVAGTHEVRLQEGDEINSYISEVSPSKTHSVTLNNLLSRTTYKYSVVSTDENNGEDESDEYEFTTDATGPEVDTTPPVIDHDGFPTVITSDSAVISFTTDERSVAYVEIDTNSAFDDSSGEYYKYGYGDESGDEYEYKLSHTIVLDFLEPDFDYVYRITAENEAAISASDPSADDDFDAHEFTTNAEEGAGETDDNDDGNIEPDVPPVILSLTIKDVGGSVATILWETDKPATRAVEYGEFSGDYDDLKQGETSLSVVHNVKLTGLSPDTKYYFIVKSVDAFGNIGESDEFSFTTNDEIDESELIADLEEKLASAATEQQISILELLGDLSESAQALVEEFLDAVALLGEDEQDKILEIVSADLIGPPRILGARPNVKLTDTTAVIEWESTKETTSEVAFATDDNYAPGEDQPYTARAGSDTAYTTQHRVEIKDLTPFTIYHYQLIGTERSGRKNLSVDRTFETLRVQPKFTKVSLTSVTEQSVTVLWRTNVETTGEVLVRNRETGEGRTVESLNPGTEHELTLRGLESENRYNLSVVATTKGGASIRSNIVPFNTDSDDRAPEIQQVRTKLTIAPGKGNDVQAIISWVTDEPSNGQVFFDEGIGKEGELRQKSPINGDLSFTHVVVLTKLRPATIYTFRAASTDISGNTGESREFKIFTPRKEESVLELIIGNFEETFGFIKNR